MHLFYTPDINGETLILNEEESKHCIRVLRLQAGDEVNLIDGRGGFYTARISDPHPKKTVLQVISEQQDFGKRNHYLHIAIAPTKNIERTEWFLEKATEIGIDEISVLICDRSERREVKNERLNKVITSAIKQSITAYHPRLNETRSFKSFLEKEHSGQKFIAHCIDSEKETLKQIVKPGGNYLVLIGPEGDFTQQEVDLAQEKGFISITLGKTRLRTETAALAACFEVNYLNR